MTPPWLRYEAYDIKVLHGGAGMPLLRAPAMLGPVQPTPAPAVHMGAL